MRTPSRTISRGLSASSTRSIALLLALAWLGAACVARVEAVGSNDAAEPAGDIEADNGEGSASSPGSGAEIGGSDGSSQDGDSAGGGGAGQGNGTNPSAEDGSQDNNGGAAPDDSGGNDGDDDVAPPNEGSGSEDQGGGSAPPWSTEPPPDDEGCGQAGCGGQTCEADILAAAPRPVRAAILLDRSQSMNQLVAGTPKWTIARRAVRQLVEDNASEVDLGLFLFPGTNRSCTMGGVCAPGRRFVAVGASDVVEAVSDVLEDAETCRFLTPIASSLEVVGLDPALADPETSPAIVLVTDGKERCDGDPVAVAASLAASSPGIRTFVVGFAVGGDPSQLNAIAEAGGTARPGPEKFYRADSETGLADALQRITTGASRCDYTVDLGNLPADTMEVLIGNERILQGGGHGWTYDAANQHLSFHGDACSLLQEQPGLAVNVRAGCPLGPSDAV